MQDDMLKTTDLCMSLSGYLPAKLHFANYSLGMMINRHRLGRTNLGGFCHEVS
jgi:hypothetical protein